jgi:hypothetical protein
MTDAQTRSTVEALVGALELGLDYAQTELRHRQDVYEGYPHRYASEMDDVSQFKAALEAGRALLSSLPSGEGAAPQPPAAPAAVLACRRIVEMDLWSKSDREAVRQMRLEAQAGLDALAASAPQPPAAPLPVSEPGPQPPDDSPPSTPYPAAAPPVQAPVAPPCVDCGGAGEVFTHAEDCESSLCALNGDIHSCTGQIEPCHCVGPVAPAAAPKEPVAVPRGMTSEQIAQLIDEVAGAFTNAPSAAEPLVTQEDREACAKWLVSYWRQKGFGERLTDAEMMAGHERSGQLAIASAAWSAALSAASPDGHSVSAVPGEASTVPLSDERLEEMWEADTTSAEDCASLYFFKIVARAVERAHGIGDGA